MRIFSGKTGFTKEQITAVALTLSFGAMLWLLLCLYSSSQNFTSLIITLIYLFLTVSLFSIYRVVHRYLQVPQALLFVAIVSQLIILSLTYAIVTLSTLESQEVTREMLPLMAVFGLLIWIISSKTLTPDIIESESRYHDEAPHDTSRMPERDSSVEILDKVSVKDGSRIHIIQLDEIEYIQAYGDYVIFHTINGKFVKEETMKFYETHLPDHFVRVHRSSIINSNKIARAELFGKESYNIYLKKGTCIKASASGYKLLKERLSI